jgi:methylthioribose-1-phosphate isomerase
VLLLSTIDRRIADGRGIPIEERDATEVRGFGSAQWAPDSVAVRNPAFDVTPADLVSALITENGVVHRPTLPGIAALFESALDGGATSV